MHGGLGICRGFPAVSVADSQRSVSPERVPHLVVTGMATVDQVVRAPGVSSLILVTDGSGEVTFIDGRHTDTPTAAHAVLNYGVDCSSKSRSEENTSELQSL